MSRFFSCESCLSSLTLALLFGTSLVWCDTSTTSAPTNVTRPQDDLLAKFSSSSILLTGMLNDHLLIITNDPTTPQLYEIPPQNIRPNQINLYGVAPVELKSKWQNLLTNGNFTSHVLKSDNQTPSTSVTLGQEDSVMFAFGSSDVGRTSVLLTVTYSVGSSNTSYKEYAIEQDDNFAYNHGHFISSSSENGSNTLYNLKIFADKSTLFKYEVSAGALSTVSQSYVCKTKDENGTEKIVFQSSQSNCALNWDIVAGFVNRKYFRLFGRDQVYIFEEGNETAELKTVPLSDFFVWIEPITTQKMIRAGSSTVKGNGLSVLITVVIIVLFAVLIALAFVAYWFLFPNKKATKKNKKPPPKPKTPKSMVPELPEEKQKTEMEQIPSIYRNLLKNPLKSVADIGGGEVSKSRNGAAVSSASSKKKNKMNSQSKEGEESLTTEYFEMPQFVTPKSSVAESDNGQLKSSKAKRIGKEKSQSKSRSKGLKSKRSSSAKSSLVKSGSVKSSSVKSRSVKSRSVKSISAKSSSATKSTYVVSSSTKSSSKVRKVKTQKIASKPLVSVKPKSRSPALKRAN